MITRFLVKIIQLSDRKRQITLYQLINAVICLYSIQDILDMPIILTYFALTRNNETRFEKTGSLLELVIVNKFSGWVYLVGHTLKED